MRYSRDASTRKYYDSGMTIEMLQRNWSLVAALVILIPVAVSVFGALMGQSRGGELKARAKAVEAARRERKRCVGKVESLGETLNALMERGDQVAPARIEKAKAALSDAIALAKVAEDQRMIAETQLRQYILDEFAPTQHEALQRRYMLGEPGR